MAIYIGIDSGGTSTRAIAANASGEVLGIGRAGTGNPNAASTEAASGALRDAISGALAQAGATLGDVKALFVGMAGVVGDKDTALAREMLTRAGVDQTKIATGVDHDIRIALAGGLTGDEGLALIAGTGSSCYGRTKDGRTQQSGGWGSILDDGGSAYGLGHAALCAAVRISDHRYPASPLLAEVTKALNLSEFRQIVEKVYRTGMSKAEVAALAPLVLAAWQAGDGVAAGLVRHGASELADICHAAATALGLTAPRICYTGGLIENAMEYREVVVAAIKAKLPGAQVVACTLPPALGAVLLAYETGGQSHTSETWARLARTYDERLK